MIGSLKYEEISNIIELLAASNENLKKMLDYYQEKDQTATVKMKRFSLELETYINYLKDIYKMNKDADQALETIKELNS